jgi:hypothetical protein
MLHHFTKDVAIIEFIDRNDEAFLDIANAREYVFDSFEVEQFEAQTLSYFDIICRQQIRPARWLYLVKRNEAVS